MRRADGGSAEEGGRGRARYQGPPASGSGRCGRNAGYGLMSAPNDPVKSSPASVPVPVIDHVPSTPRGPSEWPFPTNSPLIAAVPATSPGSAPLALQPNRTSGAVASAALNSAVLLPSMSIQDRNLVPTSRLSCRNQSLVLPHTPLRSMILALMLSSPWSSPHLTVSSNVPLPRIPVFSLTAGVSPA